MAAWALRSLVVLLVSSAVTVDAFAPVEYLQSTWDSLVQSDGIDKKTGCPKHKYQTHLLSEDPLVVYIDNFISKEEAAHLVDLT